MTEKQHIKFLRDNVKPLSMVGSKIKLELAPDGFLKPNHSYYTKNLDKTIIKWIYMPSYKSYRSDIAKMVKKNLIYMEVSEEIAIFKHNQQLKMFR